MAKRPRIAVLVETSTSWGTQLVEGIASYAHEQGPWFFYLEPRGRYERLRLPTQWTGDGIIARVTTKVLAHEIVASRIPAVTVSWYGFGVESIARCTVDEERCGRLAAEHFLERGFSHFAYFGPLRRPVYTDRFGQSYCDAVRVARFDCSIHRPRRSARDPSAWTTQLTNLSVWLKGLPKPVGLLAWNDIGGRQVTEACQYAGISVPEEVAVLGAEDDALMGAVSSPPLSSIDVSSKRVGYQAARLLGRLMRGCKRPPHPVPCSLSRPGSFRDSRPTRWQSTMPIWSPACASFAKMPIEGSGWPTLSTMCSCRAASSNNVSKSCSAGCRLPKSVESESNVPDVCSLKLNCRCHKSGRRVDSISRRSSHARSVAKPA